MLRKQKYEAFVQKSKEQSGAEVCKTWCFGGKKSSFLSFFSEKVLFLSVSFLIVFVDFLIVSAGAIRMSADRLIVFTDSLIGQVRRVGLV